MGVLSLRLSDDEEKLLKGVAYSERIPISELARRRIFSAPVMTKGEQKESDNLRPEIEAMAATLTDLADAVATLNRQLKYAQGLTISVLQIANPDGWREDMKKMKELAFAGKEG